MKIKKLIFENVPPDAPDNAPYGKYLFDPIRKDIPNSKKEPMTEVESDLLLAIQKWIETQNQTNLSFEFPDVYELAQGGEYSKFLVPENQPIYRGMSFNENGLSDFLETTGLTKEDLKVVNDRMWIFEGGTLQPPSYSKIMSWTIEVDMAAVFVQERHEYIVVLKTRPTKENGMFLLNPGKILQKMKMPKLYRDEKEVVSYGPVDYEKMVMFVTPPGQKSASRNWKEVWQRFKLNLK